MSKLFSLSALALFLLTACGGGGGSTSMPDTTSAPTPTPTPTPTPIFGPRSPPAADILNLPEASNYASKKSGFEAFLEYEPSYQVSSTGRNHVDSHLNRIHAAAAYARGATGTGETIAIVDSGILETHREFLDSGFSGSHKVIKVTQSGYSPTNADKSHGTYVAALAVGNRDGGLGLNMHGVAFDASLRFRAIALGAPSPDNEYKPISLPDSSAPGPSAPDPSALDLEYMTFFNNIIEFAKKPAQEESRATIVNMSFGVNGIISSYDRSVIISNFTHTASVLLQPNVADADKIILVWAAGNAGERILPNGDPTPFDSPEVFSGLGVYFPELQGHVLAVVALDQDGRIADYSNRCGIAKSFCLAAPGSNVVSALNDGDSDYGVRGSGTSYAAPLVSGSLALLRQYFRRQLGNTELVTRLLATANRDGVYADSDIYGHGLVDLDAATAPLGAVMTGLPGDPNSRPFAGTRIAPSGAFGVSLQDALADVEVAGFDALGAPFFQSAATWVRPPQEYDDSGRKTRKLSLVALDYSGQNHGMGLSLTTAGNAITDARLAFVNGCWVSYGQHGGQSLGNPLVREQNNNGVAVDRFHDPLAFAAPYLSLVRDGAGIGWSRASGGGSRRFGFALMHGAPLFDRQQKLGGKRGIGVLLNMTMNGKQSAKGLSLQVGAVREATSFLGTRTQGAFGEAHAATTFAGINGAWALGNDNWHLLASAYLGRTRPQINDNGLLYDASTIVSSAFSIGTARASIWRQDDWLGLRLSQPLRAESGEARLRVPAGRTKYGKVVYQNHDVSLVPTGRTIHATAIYHLPIAGGALETRISMARHPQHHSAHDIRPFMRLAFERRF